MEHELKNILRICRYAAAAGGTGVLSTGESLAAALVLNRADWLADMRYTMVEAWVRIGSEWAALVPMVTKVLAEEAQAAAIMQEGIAKAAVRPTTPENASEPVVLDYNATLVTYGSTQGRRNASLTFELREIGAAPGRPFRADLSLDPDDGETIVRHLLDVHRFAWRHGDGPTDMRKW